MQDETRGITYTPTFTVYRKGRKVRAGGWALVCGQAGGQAGRLPP